LTIGGFFHKTLAALINLIVKYACVFISVNHFLLCLNL